jgi:hypothetical protein
MENEITRKARNPRLSIADRSSLSKDEWKKYMEPQEDVKVEITALELYLKLEALKKEVTSLSILIGRNLGLVDWLQDWAPFIFGDMTSDEINQTQYNITIWVRGQLSEIDASAGVTHTINFNWEELSSSAGSSIYKLHAYLNPPAVVSGGVPGSGTSAVTPTQPKQPPPPGF